MPSIIQRIRATIFELGRGANDQLDFVFRSNLANTPAFRREASGTELLLRSNNRSTFRRFEPKAQSVSGDLVLAASDHGKVLLVDTSAARLITLPAPADGLWFIVKDSTGTGAATNNITVARNGSETIDGLSASYVINKTRDARKFFSDGTNWFIIAASYEGLLSDVTLQTLDLWNWEAGGTSFANIAASSNNLVWTVTLPLSTAHVDRSPYMYNMYARFWELWGAFGDGLTLKIIDGNGDIWLIVPKAAGVSSYRTYAVVAGTFAASSSNTFTLNASGIGTLYDVYKNGVSQANFSSFTTLSSGSVTTNSFRFVLFGTQSLVKSLVNFETLPRPKRKWIRPVLLSSNYLADTKIQLPLKFIPGKRYNVFVCGVVTVASDNNYLWRFANTTGTTYSDATIINETAFFMTADPSGVQIAFSFIAQSEGLVWSTGAAGINEEFSFFAGSTAGILMQNGIMQIMIEET